MYIWFSNLGEPDSFSLLTDSSPFLSLKDKTLELIPDINAEYYGVEFCTKMPSDREGKKKAMQESVKGLYSCRLSLWGHIMGITYSDEQPNTKEAFSWFHLALICLFSHMTAWRRLVNKKKLQNMFSYWSVYIFHTDRDQIKGASLWNHMEGWSTILLKDIHSLSVLMMLVDSNDIYHAFHRTSTGL